MILNNYAIHLIASLANVIGCWVWMAFLVLSPFIPSALPPVILATVFWHFMIRLPRLWNASQTLHFSYPQKLIGRAIEFLSSLVTISTLVYFMVWGFEESSAKSLSFYQPVFWGVIFTGFYGLFSLKRFIGILGWGASLHQDKIISLLLKVMAVLWVIFWLAKSSVGGGF